MSIGWQDSQCGLSSLDIFSGKNIQRDVEEGIWEKFTPLSTIQNGVVEFKIDGTKSFIDLQNTFIYVKARIVNTDGTNIAADKEISTVNYLAGSLWKTVTVKLNGDPIISSSDYNYRSYLETLLNYSSSSKKSWLQNGLWYKDHHGKFDTLTDVNTGFKFRKGHFAESKPVEIIGKLHCEPFTQDRYLLDNVSLEIKLTKADDNLLIMSADTENVKIVLDEVELHVRKNNLFSDKLIEIQQHHTKMDAKYPTTMVKISTEIIPTGASSFNVTKEFHGDIPKMIVIGMVKNEAYAGKKTLNPYNFEHFGLQYFNGKVNSMPIIPQPFQFDFTKKEYAQAYWNLMHSLGYAFKDDGCAISRNEFDDGYFLLAFNTSTTLCNDLYSDPIQRGKCTFELRFKQNTQQAITLIMFAEYDKMFSINTANKAISNFDG